MVQVELAQFTGECNAWREKLRGYREEFTQDKAKLQDAANQPLSKVQLQDVEHLHNQFHIQLINIHDLKQQIKTHDRKMTHEMNVNNGHLNDESTARHEKLFDSYQHLEEKLLDLRNEFQHFLESIY